MPVRLLPKSEIAKLKSVERGREIEEGLKLSRRVDGLRELASNEESKLAKYRDATLAQIQKEIGELSLQKEKLWDEVRTLRDEKSAGMRDVEQQLLSVTSLRQSLDQRKAKLDDREQGIQTNQMALDLNVKNIVEEMGRSKMREEAALNLHKASEDEHEEARRTLENARLIEERAIAFRRETEQEVGERIGQVVAREQAVEEQAEFNVITAKELDEIRIRLEDQRNTILH
jgi:hypothetical protein